MNPQHLQAIRQTSGSESGLIRKSRFESQITFGSDRTPLRRFEQSEHSLVTIIFAVFFLIFLWANLSFLG